MFCHFIISINATKIVPVKLNLSASEEEEIRNVDLIMLHHAAC